MKTETPGENVPARSKTGTGRRTTPARGRSRSTRTPVAPRGLAPGSEAPALKVVAPKEYQTPPPPNYVVIEIPVGRMNEAVDNPEIVGPQRNTVRDGPRWKQSMTARWKKYKKFNPVLLTDRVVSKRADGTLWPIDGNGSNHWVESLFGPDFKVACRVVEGLTIAEENHLFQEIQAKRKPVSRLEGYRADSLYDDTSDAFHFNRVMREEGFVVSNATLDPFGIGVTAVEWVWAARDEAGLRETLQAIKDVFSSTDPKRTNASLVKGLSIALGNPSLDRETLYRALRHVGPEELSKGARGKAAEREVFNRIREAYHYASLDPTLGVAPEGEAGPEPETPAAAPVAPVAFSGLAAAAVAAAHAQPDAPLPPVSPFLDASGSTSNVAEGDDSEDPGDEAAKAAAQQDEAGEESQEPSANYAGEDPDSLPSTTPTPRRSRRRTA